MQFLKFFAAIFIAAIAVATVITWLGSSNMRDLTTIIALIWAVVAGGLSLSFTVRRFHDIGQTGWYSLGLFVPIINLFVVLVLLFKVGDATANRYGPPIH